MTSRSESCPDEATLHQYSHGLLDESLAQQVALHLTICDRCLSRLDSIQPSSLEAVLQAPPLPEGDSLVTPAPNFIQRTMEILQQERILIESDWGQRRFGIVAELPGLSFLDRYRVADSRTQQEFVASLARPGWITSKEHRAQFFSDTQLAMRVVHPACETICDFGMWTEHQPYYLSYWIPGQTLFLEQQRRAIGWAESLRILKQLTAGLTAIHSLGILHRHVSLDSVWLNERGTICLQGVGAVYDLRYQADLLAPEQLNCRALAPEIRQGPQEFVDGRCDVYGMGRVAGGLWRKCPDLPPAAAGNLKNLISQTLSPSRRQRPATPEDFWQKLVACTT